MKQENTQLSIIVPQGRDRPIDTQVQQQIERLQQHCIVELEAVQQFHTWLDNKRHCRQASLCHWGLSDWEDSSL